MKLQWKNTSDPRIKRRGEQLYARFTKNGFRIEQKLFETKLEGAKKWADHIESMIRDGKTIADVRKLFNLGKNEEFESILISELWPDFILYKSKDCVKDHKIPWRTKTLEQYESFWQRSFEPFWGSKLPTEINEVTWQEFIDLERKRSKRGAALTFANHHKYWQGFTTYLVANQILDKKPKIWNPDPRPEDSDEDGVGIVFPDETVAAMISGSNGKFGLFVKMAALMGMRSSEITQLRKARLDMKLNLIRLRAKDVKTGTKTKRGRTIPIHPDVIPLLQEQLKATADSPFVFPNKKTNDRPMDKTGFKKRWNALKELVGVTDGRVHDLRHTYATKIFANPEVNPVLAAKALGMGLKTAMEVYIHFDETHFSLITKNINFAAPAQEIQLQIETVNQ